MGRKVRRKVFYENYPTLFEIETANYVQLVMWINWLPAPRDAGEDFKYTRIVDRKRLFFSSES